MIPFDDINHAALVRFPSLLAEWFPAGKVRGQEFVVGDLSGSAGDSLSINLRTGKWADFAAAGVGGNDPVSLYAAAFHGGRQSEGARALAGRLGINVPVNGSAIAARPPEARNGHAAPVPAPLPPPGEEEQWFPCTPAADAPNPELSRFDGVWAYRDAAGARIGYVVRIDPKGPNDKKRISPLNWGRRVWTDDKGRLRGVLQDVTGWHPKHPAEPMPLYNLDQLAARPDAPVLVVEGEKACDAATAQFPGHVCVTWPRGTNNCERVDWSPLAARWVAIWPDNDPINPKTKKRPGPEAAAKIEKLLRKLGANVRTLVIDDVKLGDQPNGEDAADITVEDPEAWLTAHLPAKERPKEQIPGLCEYLSIEAWTQRDIPPNDKLLGDLVTTTTRAFLVGSTGLGKTLVALGMACGMAAGTGFLHWPSGRAARVLYLDGEMPEELIKSRSIDALRRLGGIGTGGNLFICARDSEADLRQRFPTVPPFEPLNTPAGHDFVFELIGALGGVDAVVFDNVMSLITGDQKDEIPWSETTPLIQQLTSQRVGQIWVDHTGHNTDRQYGSSTKAWRFDAVGLMAALPKEEREKHEVAFTLSFDHPGKARRRTPDNWRDFETRTIRLAGDEWISTTFGEVEPEREAVKLSPAARAFYGALTDALAVSSTPGRVTRDQWHAECARLGLLDPIHPGDSRTKKEDSRKKLRKYISEFKILGLIGVNGEEIMDLRK